MKNLNLILHCTIHIYIKYTHNDAEESERDYVLLWKDRAE